MTSVVVPVLKVPWATWMPTTNGGKGNGSYPSTAGNPKIVLYLTEKTSPSANDPAPPHLTLDIGSEGRAWQHVDMYKPAYGLGTGSDSGKNYNANYDAGRIIQVAIIAPALWNDPYKKSSKIWWTLDRVDRLAWFLGYIHRMDISPTSSTLYVWDQLPFDFEGHPDDKNKSRKSWDEFSKAKGILGRMHCPFNTDQWGPSDLPEDQVKFGLKHWSEIFSVPKSGRGAAAPLTDVVVEESAKAPPETQSPGGAPINPDGSPADTPADTKPVNPDLVDVSVAGKEFWFNPPLHKMNLPVRVDFVSDDPTLAKYYPPETGALATGTEGVKQLAGLRLGRIIQHEFSSGKAAQGKYRWGFRFLYNPTSVKVVASRNNHINIDSSSTRNTIISGINQNFQVIAFQLLLNRQPDLIQKPHLLTDYEPSITQDQKNGLGQYGTHYDLQALYRVCNGDWDLEDRGFTSDIGFINPAPARLLLGPGRNYYGFVEAVQYTHTMFDKKMIPILTTVDITFRRHMDMTADALASFGELTGNEFLTPEEEAEQALMNTFDAPCPKKNKVSRDYLVDGGKHRGYDYTDVDYGNPVLACAPGTVVHAGPATPNKGQSWGDWAGTHVVIDTAGIRHGYCHLSKALPPVGAMVAPGDKIGEIGKTGNVLDSGGGDVLHYEERVSPWKDLNDRKPVFAVKE